MYRKPTLIWEGKIHLGERPGVYGDANYCGLSIKFPLTIKSYIQDIPEEDTISIELSTRNVNLFSEYIGHIIILTKHIPNPSSGCIYSWEERVIKSSERITHGATSTIVEIQVSGNSIREFLSLGIHIDNSVRKGIYDDFLLTGLHYTTKSSSVYLNLGFTD